MSGKKQWESILLLHRYLLSPFKVQERMQRDAGSSGRLCNSGGAGENWMFLEDGARVEKEQQRLQKTKLLMMGTVLSSSSKECYWFTDSFL